jgi:cytochrome P450
MGKGLLTLDHADWRPRRKVVQPGFAPRRIEQGAAEAVPATEATLRRWTGLAAAGRPVNVADDLMDISARVIGTALVSRDLSEPGVGYSRAAAIVSKVMYTEATKGVNSLLPGWLPTRYHRERKWAHGVLDAIVGRVLARRATDDLGADVATLMLEADLPDQAIADDLRTLLLAGSDTTGQALAWTLYELARHPQARREVEEEVDRVLADGPPHPGMLDQLPVTRSAIDEALRLHPPVWQFPRDAIADDELDGCPVRAGSTVLMSIYGTHRSPEQWDDPDTFDPARFRGDRAKDRHRFAYFPFGGGRRLCIGRPLALGTLTIAVAMISRRFRLVLSDAHPVESASYITLFPRDGLTATVVERR